MYFSSKNSYINNLRSVGKIYCFNSSKLQNIINGDMVQPVLVKVHKVNLIAWNKWETNNINTFISTGSAAACYLANMDYR